MITMQKLKRQMAAVTEAQLRVIPRRRGVNKGTPATKEQIDAIVAKSAELRTEWERTNPDTSRKTGHVYRITNTENGFVYIGVSINVEARLKQHEDKLNRGSHVNKNLQSAWDYFPHRSFVFEVIKELPVEHLFIEESIMILMAPNTYNIVGVPRRKKKVGTLPCPMTAQT